MPVVWPKETTRLQAQLFNLVFVGQMSGHYYTVSDLAKLLDQPRSTTQHAADKLIDNDRLSTESDYDDGRRRLLVVSKNMMHEVGALESLIIRLLFYWHKRLERIAALADNRRAEQQRLAVIEEAIRKLEAIE